MIAFRRFVKFSESIEAKLEAAIKAATGGVSTRFESTDVFKNGGIGEVI